MSFFTTTASTVILMQFHKTILHTMGIRLAEDVSESK